MTGRVPSLNTGSGNSTDAFPLCPVSLTGSITGQLRVREEKSGCTVGVGSVLGSVGAGSVVGSVGVGSVVGAVGSGAGWVDVDVVTTTLEVHEAFCCAASAAVQVNDVVPTENSEPDAGEQLVEIGATPPLTVGLNVTEMGLPSGEVNTGEGHEIERTGTAVGTLPDISGDGAPSVPAVS